MSLVFLKTNIRKNDFQIFLKNITPKKFSTATQKVPFNSTKIYTRDFQALYDDWNRRQDAINVDQ